MKIEVNSTEIETFSGTSKTNRPYTIRKQKAYAFIHGDKYPTPFTISLEENQQPFQPGLYLLDETSLYVNKYGQLSIGRLKLAPAVKAA